MHYDTVFFDLDGTISDSVPGIINSIKYALVKAEYPPLTQEQLLSCVGPPLAEHLAYLVGVDDEEGRRLQSLYREYYSVKGIYENSLYDGIRDMLARLFDKGCKMYICTGKPEKFARIVLDHFDISRYFIDVLGTTMDGKHSDKTEALATLLTRCDKGNYLFVGDRKFDVIAAHNNSMPCAGVLWGCGGREELEKSGAEVLAEDAQQLYRYITKGKI